MVDSSHFCLITTQTQLIVTLLLLIVHKDNLRKETIGMTFDDSLLLNSETLGWVIIGVQLLG